MDKPTVQDIFLRFYPRYLEQYRPSPQQAKTANNIINCKTGAYGANVSVCEDCRSIQIHYNSCRNRCCPMCQALPKEKWIDLRREDVLDAPYFHVVFTMPEELNPVIYSNLESLLNYQFKNAHGEKYGYFQSFERSDGIVIVNYQLSPRYRNEMRISVWWPSGNGRS